MTRLLVCEGKGEAFLVLLITVPPLLPSKQQFACARECVCVCTATCDRSRAGDAPCCAGPRPRLGCALLVSLCWHQAAPPGSCVKVQTGTLGRLERKQCEMCRERMETGRFAQTLGLVTEHIYKCRRSLKCRHLLDQCTYDAHAKISEALGIHYGSASVAVVLQLHRQYASLEWNELPFFFLLGYSFNHIYCGK